MYHDDEEGEDMLGLDQACLPVLAMAFARRREIPIGPPASPTGRMNCSVSLGCLLAKT
jgi:hypothetical protein